MPFTINPPGTALTDAKGKITAEWYRFLVRLQKALGEDTVQDIKSSSVLTYAASDVFNNERVLSGGTGLSLVIDPFLATMNLDDTGVAPGTYGSSAALVQFSVDQQGRITSATAVSLNSDNVTEGVTHLFFSDARARGSVSASSPLSYNSGTGVFSLGTVGTPNGGTGITTYTAGDLLYYSAGSALSKLPIGASGDVLTSSGSAPQWTPNTGTGNVARASRPQFTTTIGVGAAASVSGSGVSFPATQSASTDPNTLDDYEESDSFVPVVSSSSGTITSYTSSCAYTKIGRLVTATISIFITNNGTGSGSVNCTMPFTASTTIPGTGGGRENAISGKQLQGYVPPGFSSMSIFNYDNTYPAVTGSELIVTISYTV